MRRIYPMYIIKAQMMRNGYIQSKKNGVIIQWELAQKKQKIQKK
ncbi:MAG: hypothetical protein CNLJKLNK_00721 [Holosporales bacterium]